MCVRSYPKCSHEKPTTERQKLAAAIERLEKLKWCDDATLALKAARKHLETLPEVRYRISRLYDGQSYSVERHTPEEASKVATHWIASGCSSVSIVPV